MPEKKVENEDGRAIVYKYAGMDGKLPSVCYRMVEKSHNAAGVYIPGKVSFLTPDKGGEIRILASDEDRELKDATMKAYMLNDRRFGQKFKRIVLPLLPVGEPAKPATIDDESDEDDETTVAPKADAKKKLSVPKAD